MNLSGCGLSSSWIKEIAFKSGCKSLTGKESISCSVKPVQIEAALIAAGIASIIPPVLRYLSPNDPSMGIKK